SNITYTFCSASPSGSNRRAAVLQPLGTIPSRSAGVRFGLIGLGFAATNQYNSGRLDASDFDGARSSARNV
ncbi:hypothetical protein PENTCL1PPCAC_24248, partial [Pristionchus entomophagus]